MQISKYIQNYQQIVYKSFSNALQTNRLSHAYLLVGNNGTPLLDVAKYLSKSILCDDPSPLACDNCITCLRVDENNYPDLLVFDGSKRTIKKEDVSKIETQFEKKAFEDKGIMIYILNLVENMTPEAVNSILKFLEEPGVQIYAFLTTNNESMILPTIVSRCQIFRINQIDRNIVINEAIENGIAQEDAELLSKFYNSSDLIKEAMKDKDEKEKEHEDINADLIKELFKGKRAPKVASDDEEDEIKEVYLKTKELVFGLLESFLNEGKRGALFFMDKNVVPYVKKVEIARFFLDMLADVFENILNIKNGNTVFLQSYVKILTDLAGKIEKPEDSLLEILKDRNILNTNVNIALLLDHVMLNI